MGVSTGMTNAALAEHYANCIKLSAENVISKNDLKIGKCVIIIFGKITENQHEKCLQSPTN
jgi:hypothetical protein